MRVGAGPGWLDRLHGLACDNLVAADLVTAAGEELHGEADHHRGLFWALPGRDGNFGVVTALKLALHPVVPPVQAGLFFWPTDECGRDVARAYRDWVADAPEELGSWLLLTVGPDEDSVPRHLVGRVITLLAATWRLMPPAASISTSSAPRGGADPPDLR